MPDEVRALEQEVEASPDAVVHDFGARAQRIVSAAEPQLQRSVDGALEVLFHRQLARLRRQHAASSEGRTGAAVAEADRQFVAAARALMRPGSAWSFEGERLALHAVLQGAFRREAGLAEERALAKQTRSDIRDVIGALQAEIEAHEAKAQQFRMGSPWTASLSYRIPKKPLKVTTRFTQGGRFNIGLSMTPDEDPANADAGFVSGIWPANVGVSINLGN